MTDLPIELRDGVSVREATEADVDSIVRLIAADQIAAGRESPDDLRPYLAAFASIEADPNQLLVVLDRGGLVVGTLQLTFIPGLSRRGAQRALIEAVRVAKSERGLGLGHTFLSWAIDHARARGCALVQLTSDARRTDARRFYERLGFVASHTGFKRWL